MLVAVLSWVAISGAWFFTVEETPDLPINQVNFRAELTFEDLDGEEVPLRFNLKNSTKLDRNSKELNFTPEGNSEEYFANRFSRDYYFNEMIFVTRVVITNIGDVALSPRVFFELNENCALRAAILLIDTEKDDLAVDDFLFTRYGREVIDFRHYIWEQLSDLDSNEFPYTGQSQDTLNALNAINRVAGGFSVGDGERIELAPLETKVFTIVAWVDHQALLELKDNNGNPIFSENNTSSVIRRIFTLNLRIRAVDLNAPEGWWD